MMDIQNAWRRTRAHLAGTRHVRSQRDAPQVTTTGNILQTVRAVGAARGLLRALEASAVNEAPAQREEIARALERAADVAGDVPQAVNELRSSAERVRALDASAGTGQQLFGLRAAPRGSLLAPPSALYGLRSLPRAELAVQATPHVLRLPPVPMAPPVILRSVQCASGACLMRQLAALDDTADRYRATSAIANGSQVTVLGSAYGTVRFGGLPIGPREWTHARFDAPDGTIHEGWMYPENLLAPADVGTGAATGQAGTPAIIAPSNGGPESAMFAALNASDRRAVSFVPRGASVIAFETRTGTAYASRDDATCNRTAWATGMTCPWTDLRSALVRPFRRALYRAPDGVDHEGWIDARDFAPPVAAAPLPPVRPGTAPVMLPPGTIRTQRAGLRLLAPPSVAATPPSAAPTSDLQKVVLYDRVPLYTQTMWTDAPLVIASNRRLVPKGVVANILARRSGSPNVPATERFGLDWVLVQLLTGGAGIQGWMNARVLG
jgi:hypothetical protein